MATLDQIAARRRKDLIAAEIEARRKGAEYTMGLLAGFDPDSPVATRSVMPPDPTWQGTGYQEALGDKETILDRRRDIWDQVPDMRTQEFDHTMMLPIPRAEPFDPADMVPLRKPIRDMPPIESDGLQYDIDIDGAPR